MWRVRLWRNLQSESGFTLIELLGVAVILIVLALMAIPVYADVTDTAREGRSREELRIISQALDNHYADHGWYPASLNGLVQGVNNHSYLKPTEFDTAWTGMKYYYVLNSSHGYVLGILPDGTTCHDACNPGRTGPVRQDGNLPSFQFVQYGR